MTQILIEGTQRVYIKIPKKLTFQSILILFIIFSAFFAHQISSVSLGSLSHAEKR